ncbi:hypothetical protein V5T82_15285 [Magnetovibrio sp. PR-2]|uniref:hypothetical protein n=1 Tax=Magnetovibrio sp. PR-2 TaxID=3120356 RepID=UPI002FCDE7A6
MDKASLPTLRMWARRMWIVAAVGFAIAISPLVIALIGMAVGSMELQTYHWLLYMSVPLGGGISILSVVTGVVLIIVETVKGQSHD